VTSVWQLPALIGAVLAWLNAPAVSLADAARHEAVRRALSPPAVGAYTNADLPPARWSELPASKPSGVEGEPEAAPKAPAVFPAFERPSEDALPAASDEQAWRSRLAGLVAVLDRDRTRLVNLQSQVAALQTDVMHRDDPAQRAQLAQDLSKALGELDRVTSAVQADEDALDAFRQEARRQGVPPGWVRP